MILRCTEDNGGGFVHVKRPAVRSILGSDSVWISERSRLRGEMVYLHLDDDFELFKKAAEAKGIPIRITRRKTDRKLSIRGYEPFHPDRF